MQYGTMFVKYVGTVQHVPRRRGGYMHKICFRTFLYNAVY